MFEFGKLTGIERYIILIIGNPIKSATIRAYINMKDRKENYNEHF